MGKSISNKRQKKYESMRLAAMLITLGISFGIDMSSLLVEFPNADGSGSGIATVTVLNFVTALCMFYLIVRRTVKSPIVVDDDAPDPGFDGVVITRGCENLSLVDLLIVILFIVRIVETAKFVSVFEMTHLDFVAPIPALTFSFAMYLFSVFARLYTPVMIIQD